MCIKCFSFLCLTRARALEVLHSPGLLSQRSPALAWRPALSSMSSLAKGWTGHEIGRRPRWLQASQNSCFFTLTKRNQSICWLFHPSHRYGCWDRDGLTACPLRSRRIGAVSELRHVWGSPGDPVLRTRAFSAEGAGWTPGWGLDIPQAVRCGQNQETQKMKERQNSGVCDSQPGVFPEDTVPHTVSRCQGSRGPQTQLF